MTWLHEIKRELAILRQDLEFIEGQLHNEAILETEDLSELKSKDIAKLMRKNEKLMTEVVMLETLLESQ